MVDAKVIIYGSICGLLFIGIFIARPVIARPAPYESNQRNQRKYAVRTNEPYTYDRDNNSPSDNDNPNNVGGTRRYRKRKSKSIRK